MVLPRWRMNSGGRHCASLSSPFFEGPIPANVNQGSDNYYFNQQSHTKGEIRKRPWAKAILIFCGKLALAAVATGPVGRFSA
jgi:hypothetical protein